MEEDVLAILGKTAIGTKAEWWRDGFDIENCLDSALACNGWIGSTGKGFAERLLERSGTEDGA